LTNISFFGPVDLGIGRVEHRMLGQAEGLHPELSAALRHLINAGGKRIRTAVTLLTGGMLGAHPDRLVTLASAIELLHTATLVHDDLIDGALIRRGSTTINAQWSPAATVLTGDYVFARAAQLASETDSIPIMTLFASTLAVIVNGEISQMFGKRELIDRAVYEKRIYAKTASLFETACKSAAMLSTQDEAIWEKMRIYGYKIGMAFQIVDDVLDFTGEQATLGKPVASDLRQGIVTLPVILFLEQYHDPTMIQAVVSGEAAEGEILRLVDEIRDGGAIEASLQIANDFVEGSLIALAELPDSVEKKSLESLARYIVERRK
jgi:geranylgeranyl pyrophosphate synthase